jgi:hypothetical protein
VIKGERQGRRDAVGDRRFVTSSAIAAGRTPP